VTGDNRFQVHLANDEALVQKHTEISGFEAMKVTEVFRMIDPTTVQAD